MTWDKNYIKLRSAFCLFLFIANISSTFALESHNKFWIPAVLIGPIKCNSPFKYYFEPQIRLEDNPYVFNQFFLLGGLGYQFTPDIQFFTGPGWVVTKTNQGEMIHEFRFWQQLTWQLFKNLNSRTRLEERKITTESTFAWRLRERLWLRIPFPCCEKYFFSAFDEVFFNLNHPRWVSNRFFEQNRAILGIGTKISKSTMIDVGYLNQYLFIRTPQMNHVLLVNFTVNF